MIEILTAGQIEEFEKAFDDCASLPTPYERDQRLNAVADPKVRHLVRVAFEEPNSIRDLAPGMRMDDYELIELLGSGGFGEVWRARRNGSPPGEVALKLMRSQLLRGSDAAKHSQLFREEIERHRALDHPNIVKPLSAGFFTLPGCRDSIPYLAMELWPGAPLHDACRGRPVMEKIRCFLGVCEAVQYAHRHGLMHLDLKPENILVKDQGGQLQPGLLDFGIARQFRAERPLDFHRFGAGTLPYKAPEQIDPSLGGEDFRTDVHALGVILFQLLTDHLPYKVEFGNVDEYRESILTRPRRRLSEFDASIPPALEAICQRAMELDPSKRFDSPARLAEALRRWLRQRRAPARNKWLAAAVLFTLLCAVLAVTWERSRTRVVWKKVPVTIAGGGKIPPAVWDGVSFMGDEGLLGGSPRGNWPAQFAGEGLILHTSDAGKTWTEIPRANFPADSGTIRCFGGHQETWSGLGPLNFVDVHVNTWADGRRQSVGWAAGKTGVYSCTNLDRPEATWERITPPPDDPGCYSYYSGLAELNDYKELYTYGWQGIGLRKLDGRWEIQLPTTQFLISSLYITDRNYLEAWAASNGGGGSPSDIGRETDIGAIFHYDSQHTNWERVLLPGITLSPRQNFQQIIGLRKEGELWAVGSEGLILHGMLQGAHWTWKKCSANTAQSLVSICADNNLDLWIVGSDGLILKSTDDGNSWREYPCYDENGARIRSRLNKIYFFGTEGWIVGDDVVLRYVGP